MRRLLAVLLLAVMPAAARGERLEVAGLSFEVPVTWRRLPAGGVTRPVAFALPRAEDDAQEVKLEMMHYGPAQAKFAQQNLEGWTRMFETSAGRPGKEDAMTTKRQVGELSATVIDLTGVYTGGLSEEERQGTIAGAKPGWRLVGAVLEGPPPGPWYWRMIGPERTVAAAMPAFDAMLDSSRPAAK